MKKNEVFIYYADGKCVAIFFLCVQGGGMDAEGALLLDPPPGDCLCCCCCCCAFLAIINRADVEINPPVGELAIVGDNNGGARTGVEYVE
jgi:hypothetical protein